MNTKWRWESFSFYDRSGIVRRLEAMAAQGWMLEDITPVVWKYRRCPGLPVQVAPQLHRALGQQQDPTAKQCQLLPAAQGLEGGIPEGEPEMTQGAVLSAAVGITWLLLTIS